MVASGLSLWPTARTARGGYQRDNGDPTKERPTLEGLAEIWRTPLAGDHRRGSTSKRGRSSGYVDPHGHTLNNQVVNWRTPVARDADRGASPNPTVKAGEHSLLTQAGRWMTPQATDHGSPSPPRMKTTWKRDPAYEGNWRVDLKDQAALWPTASASFNGAMDLEAFDQRRARLKAQGMNGNGMGETLAIAALRASTWPTPMSRDHRSGYAQRTDEQLWGVKGKPLERVATTWPTPAATETRQGYQRRPEGMASLQAQQSLTTIAVDFRLSPPAPRTQGGPTSSPPALSFYLRLRHTTDSALRSEMRALLRMGIRSRGRGWTKRQPLPFVRPSFRKRLNATFVEWLMGWPFGLSGFERQGTEFSRWLRQMRGCVCQLGSPRIERQGQLL